MSSLRDMEEHVLNVVDLKIRDYMKEAIKCYSISAYRGCILMCFIAIIEDITKKLSTLRKTNSKAKNIYTEVNKRKAAQDVYENYLLEKLKANDLLTELDHFRLERIKSARNKCAHPSGYSPSAEEARFIFTESIDCVLSKKTLLGIEHAEEIINKLKDNNFFPTVFIEKICSIVNEEVKELTEESYHYLIEKLCDIIEKEPDGSHKNNARLFITGLTRHGNPNILKAIYTKVIKQKCTNSNFRASIMEMIGSNALLIRDADQPTLDRLKAFLFQEINITDRSRPITQTAHPINIFNQISKQLGNDFIVSQFAEQYKNMVDKFFYYISFENYHTSEILYNLYFQTALSKASSSTFSTANEFAIKFPELDTKISNFIKNDDAFCLICGILQAADYNAFDAISLRDNKFSSLPVLKKKAKEHATANIADAEAIANQYNLNPNSVINTYLS